MSDRSRVGKVRQFLSKYPAVRDVVDAYVQAVGIAADDDVSDEAEWLQAMAELQRAIHKLERHSDGEAEWLQAMAELQRAIHKLERHSDGN